MFESPRPSKSHLAKQSMPDFTTISKGTTLLGRLRFGFSYQTCHISIRTPNWLGNAVYSVMSQQSMSGWQLNLSSYAVVDEIPDGVADAVENDDIIDLQRRLREAKLTPYVHEQDGWNLLTVSTPEGLLPTLQTRIPALIAQLTNTQLEVCCNTWRRRDIALAFARRSIPWILR